MSCPEYKTEIIEASRYGGIGGRLRLHLDSCECCSNFLDEQMAVTDAVRTLGGPHEIPAPAGLERHLLNEFDAAWPAKSRAWKWAWAPLLAAAAMLLLFWQHPKPVPPMARISKPAPAVAAPAEARAPAAISRHAKKRPAPAVSDPFIPIPYTMPLAPYERAQVMQVDMPVAELIAAGLPISATDQGALARADVLVGDDGRARAVRVISIFERSFER